MNRCEPTSRRARRAALARTLWACVVLGGMAVPLPVAAAAPQGPPPAPVRVDPVRSELLRERRRVTGDLRAVRRSKVATEEPGLVVELAVREGMLLEPGQPIARLDAKRLTLEAATLKSQELVAEATLEERTNDVALAARDLEAIRLLAQKEASNPKELGDAETAHLVSLARLEQAKQALAVLAARKELLQERIEDTVIRAPFGGVVTARYTEIGQWLPEGNPVVELVSSGEVEVWLEVPQRDLPAMRAKLGPIRVLVEATGESVLVEEYRTIGLVDQRSRAFPVIARMPELAGLAPGMSVTAEVQTGATAEHLTVAPDAVLRSETGPYVYLALPGAEGAPAQAVPIPIEILFRTKERVVVRPGALTPGAPVIVEGNERLFPTAPVQVVGGPTQRAPGGTPPDSGPSPEPESAPPIEPESVPSIEPESGTPEEDAPGGEGSSEEAPGDGAPAAGAQQESGR